MELLRHFKKLFMRLDREGGICCIDRPAASRYSVLNRRNYEPEYNNPAIVS